MLANRVCLVTGATRGIGKAIALTLAKQGATVFGTATSESGAQTISTYLEESGLAGEGMVLDVNDAEQIAGVISGAPAFSVTPEKRVRRRCW